MNPTRVLVFAVAAGLPLACNGLLGHRAGMLAEAGSPEAGDEAGNEVPDPLAIFGSRLAVWLDADDGSTFDFEPDASRIAHWTDKSGHGNDAKAIYSDAGSLSVQNVGGGRSGVVFSGITDSSGIFRINDRLSLQWGSGDFFVAAVVAYTNFPDINEFGGYASVWQKSGAAWPYWGVSISLNASGFPLPDGGNLGAGSHVWGGVQTFAEGIASGAWSATDGWNDGKLHLFGVRKSVADQRIYVHTDHRITPAGPSVDIGHDLSQLGRPVLIGGYNSNGRCCYAPLEGVLAEIIAVGGVTTSAEIAALETYVQNKYSITF